MKVMLVVQATKPKKRTAEQKAHDSMKYWDKRQKHESAVYRKMFSKAQGYDFDSHFEKNQIKKKKLIRKRDNCLKLVDAANKRKKQAENNYKKAKDKYDRIVTQRIDLSNKLAEIAEHNTGWKNEGKCAIYRSDGKGEIIYISPADGESENVSSNITSYPVDEGAPY
ncbi:MAG: LysM domain-containing protein, partial [Lactobacillus crispatus]|nr:LysM domain-containing protein [Lactobacillus crispatus]